MARSSAGLGKKGGERPVQFQALPKFRLKPKLQGP
jgi:hypothetical protein